MYSFDYSCGMIPVIFKSSVCHKVVSTLLSAGVISGRRVLNSGIIFLMLDGRGFLGELRQLYAEDDQGQI